MILMTTMMMVSALQEYKNERSRVLAGLEFLEGPISAGFLNGGDSDVALFATLPNLTTFVNTNDEDGPVAVANVLVTALNFHHSEPQVLPSFSSHPRSKSKNGTMFEPRTLVFKWPLVSEDFELGFIFQKVFADFHEGGDFEGMKFTSLLSLLLSSCPSLLPPLSHPT